MSGPRIALLAGRPAAGESGRVGRLADRLRSRGFAVDVIGPPEEPASGFEAPGTGRRLGRAWAVRRLADATAPGRPEVLHVLGAQGDAVGLALAERWKVPYLLGVEEFLPIGGRLRLGRRWCRALVAASAALAADLETAAVPRSWITVIPPGVDIPAAGPPATGGIPVVATAGALSAGSGVATFLDAARRIVASGVAAEFVVAGEGPAEPDLRRVADRLGIGDRVTFAARPAADAHFWHLPAAYCQPSTRPDAGRTLLAALAHGLPTVVADVPGLRGWIDPGRTGLIVPPGDPEALAAALLGLLADPRTARNLGDAARGAVAQRCDPKRQANDLAALYHAVLADPGPLPAAATRRS